MTNFIQDVLDNLDNGIEFEIPGFSENSDEEILIPDAFVFDNIETM